MDRHSGLKTHDRLEIHGFSIGHAGGTEGMTGVSVVLCPAGAVAAAEVRGTATGTRQFDSLIDPGHIATRAHAVVLAGGSGFGLGCSDGVVAWLESQGAGFDSGVRLVPLVPTAILFDLAFGDPKAVPSPEMARSAAEAAVGGVQPQGSLGAGTGATVGKANGPECGMKGGIGFSACTLDDGTGVAVLVAVNALGDVVDPISSHPVAGCRVAADSLERDSSSRILLEPHDGHAWDSNTTLVVVMTDAALGRTQVRKVCAMAFGGVARALDPALTEYDGDLVVALSLGDRTAHAHQVGVAAQQLTGEAIVNAVRAADGFGLLPAVADLGGAP